MAQTATLAAGVTASPISTLAAVSPCNFCVSETVSLCGTWLFRADPNGDGNKQNWFRIDRPSGDWREVQVPHTWQVEPGFVDYRSVGWYWRTFDVPERWADAAVRLEFEAVFHSATVWINGQQAGEHLRKGYTAFALDISHLLRLGQSNLVVVRVDGSFDMHMLPRGRQSDWAHDGGIFRPVQLLVTPKTFIDRIEVEAVPDLMTAGAALTITAHCRNTGASIWTGGARFRVVDEATELAVVEVPEAGSLDLPAGTSQTQTFRATLPAAKLWHFDHPNLYRLEFSIANVRESHQLTTTFGVRRFEIKDGGFLLNGEPVRLMGVERMGGSNPDFGMAEPWDLIKSDHDDLKRLNCVFTRVHWPQDRRVLDYCDRYGILMQSEVPAWGGDTFEGVGAEPDADILENGLEQLREMITRDRNHPSIIAWGLCNEIWGSNPPAYQFARRLLEEAKKLDPRRLCSYASNSLAEHPEKDVAGLMDIIEANEYFGTWAPGTVEDMTRHLDRLHAVFPGKPIVISEYGYCACTPDRPEGDVSRIEVLRSHTAVFRSKPFVGGAIFFCYNDYRTHVGDRGVGPLVQRVHGVVDLYGHPKPSYAVLREESSPIESLSVENRTGAFLLQLKTRADFPRYTLRGYRLRAVLFGKGEVPEEQQEVALPELAPGGNFSTELRFGPSAALHVDFDVLRPTRISVHTLRWKP